MFEYAEHRAIGNALTLFDENSNPKTSEQFKFKLQSGLMLTYGEINGLAGDFFGTKRPISSGTTWQDRVARFYEAFNTLYNETDVDAIQSVLQVEVDTISIHTHSPSQAYSELSDTSTALVLATAMRPLSQPGYLGLAKVNFDHFGKDARGAFTVGHACAIAEAVDGNLMRAYQMNAFADHFLQDLFSAGHLRTPRRELHGSDDVFSSIFSAADRAPDLCAKAMHDEDCALGVIVPNPLNPNEKIHIYGDKRYFDPENADNRHLISEAMQSSVADVFEAYLTKTIKPWDDWQLWKLLPSLDYVLDDTTQTTKPLFTAGHHMRVDLGDRTSTGMTTDWSFEDAWGELSGHKAWAYPMAAV